jgi:hypothetical protein
VLKVYSAQSTNKFLLWKFEKNDNRLAVESVSQTNDSIEGNFRFTDGIEGGALKLDGFTSVIKHQPDESDKISGSFSVETWLALGAYPWNWCPVITQMNSHDEGFSFEIGPRGELGFRINIGGNVVSCISDVKIPIRKWVHIASVYEEGIGLKVFLNGKQEGFYPTTGRARFSPKEDFLIGMNYTAVKPSNQIGDTGNKPYWYSLDGIIDELTVINSAQPAKYFKDKFADYGSIPEPNLQKRIMPRGPQTTNRFKAYYAKLKYYEEWDNLWPVSSDPDVVVTFKDTPVRFIFWRGTRYSPAWVTDKDQWMCDQSVEAWNDAEGCYEHMQDRHCRYSHVRIIEDTDARKVIHWRYAPVSAYNNLWRENEKTGWAVWVDEYYYIYPDATAIRKIEWNTGALGFPRQFQESLPLTNPEQLQGDILEADYLAVANLKGDVQYFEYLEDMSKANKKKIPESPNVQKHNFKSPYDPFIIFEPGNNMHYISDRDIESFQSPGTCNHWPVGQAYCDGRRTQAIDRPSHFLGFPISNPVIHQKNGRSYLNSIYGMKNITIEQLVEIGKSWTNSADLQIVSKDGFKGGEYKTCEKAYKLKKSNSVINNKLEFVLNASADSPVINPAFVIDKWGENDVKIELNGKALVKGKDYYTGYSSRMEGTGLNLWINIESRVPVSISVIPDTKQ